MADAELTQPPSNDTNPYATPTTKDVAAPTPSHENLPDPPIPLDASYCIKQGWLYTKKNFGQLLLLGLTYIGIILIFTAIEVALGEGSGLAFLVKIISNIFSIFLSLGLTSYGLKLLRGETSAISEIFSQGDKVLKAIGANIVMFLIVLLGLVLLIIPGIYMAFRLMFFQTAMVEKDLGVFDSLKYSWELTRTNTLNVFILWLLSILVILAGVIALFVGLLWATPTVYLSYLIAYRYLHQGEDGFQKIGS